MMECHRAAGVQGLYMGISESVGHFPEFIFSVLSLIHCFAPFPFEHHIPPDMMIFQSPFWGEFSVCFVGFFFQNTAGPM